MASNAVNDKYPVARRAVLWLTRVIKNLGDDGLRLITSLKHDEGRRWVVKPLLQESVPVFGRQVEWPTRRASSLNEGNRRREEAVT